MIGLLGNLPTAILTDIANLKGNGVVLVWSVQQYGPGPSTVRDHYILVGPSIAGVSGSTAGLLVSRHQVLYCGTVLPRSLFLVCVCVCVMRGGGGERRVLRD